MKKMECAVYFHKVLNFLKLFEVAYKKDKKKKWIKTVFNYRRKKEYQSLTFILMMKKEQFKLLEK